MQKKTTKQNKQLPRINKTTNNYNKSILQEEIGKKMKTHENNMLLHHITFYCTLDGWSTASARHQNDVLRMLMQHQNIEMTSQ